MESTLQETIDVIYRSCVKHPGTLVTYQTDDILAIIEGLGGVKKADARTAAKTEKKTKKEN